MSDQHVVAFKAEAPAKRMVWAEVYTPDVPDSDNEFMRAEEIEKMAYNFMRAMKLDSIDSMHTNELVAGCCVIESFIARPGDPDFNEGAWVVGVHIPDDAMWGKVEKGEINGFSMEALVMKVPQEVTLDIAPVLTGKTHKAEGHDHDYLVAYDDHGRFLGGRTTAAEDGHFHVIKRGTATEVEGGHGHRFSHVEHLNIPT